MKLKFNLPSWCGLVLLALLAAGLSGCTSTIATAYTSSCTDADGKACTDPYGKPISDSFNEEFSADGFGDKSMTSSKGVGTELSSLPYGASVSLDGKVTARSGTFAKVFSEELNSCVSEKCNSTRQNGDLQSCPARSEYQTQCEASLNKKSSSATCPVSCDKDRLPVLVVGWGGVACQCPTRAPSCDDTLGLNKLNAKGQPAWDTCTPVELPKTMLQAPANDPLLKQMMAPGAAGCTRVYSLVLHKYVCQ